MEIGRRPGRGYLTGTMHEMSLITNILEIAAERAHQAGDPEITAIEIEVGQLAAVEIPALRFCFQAAREHTVGAQAELVIHEIPGRGVCPRCGEESAADFFAAVCPACGQGVLEITQGKELKVRSIQVASD